MSCPSTHVRCGILYTFSGAEEFYVLFSAITEIQNEITMHACLYHQEVHLLLLVDQYTVHIMYPMICIQN